MSILYICNSCGHEYFRKKYSELCPECGSMNVGEIVPDSDIRCPFCGVYDFDKIGLKDHLRTGSCYEYIRTKEL